MSDKYCPAGKIECEHHRNCCHLHEPHDICHESGEKYGIGLDGYEQCPWPSKQKKVQSKYEKAWELYRQNHKRTDTKPIDDFIQALKEAGL